MRQQLRHAMLVSTAAVCITMSACSDKTRSTSQPAAPVKGIAIGTAQQSTVPDRIEVPGTVRSRISAAVAARIPGTLSALMVSEGDRVVPGQLLARLDSAEITAQAKAAQAQTLEARAALDEARTRRTLAETTFERYRKLYDEQALTRQEYDQKVAERDLAVQGLARAEARLRQAREGERAAGSVADYSKIIAPIGGIVAVRQAEPGATVFPSQPLFIIEGESGYQLELMIPENMISRLRRGMPLQITLDSLNATFSARLQEIVPAGDPASRTFTVKVPIQQPGVRSGMFGRAHIPLNSDARGIFIPRSAVFERGALVAVWTVGADNLARMRLIKTGRRSGDQIEVLAGLDAGERFVLRPTAAVTDGVKLEP